MKRFLVPLLLILGFSLVVDSIVFQGIGSLTATSSENWRQMTGWLYWCFSVGLVLVMAGAFYYFFPGKKHLQLLNKLFNTFLTLFVTKLVFALLLVVNGLFRLALSFVNLLQHPGLQAFPQRSWLFTFIASGISGIPFLALVFGITRGKYHYKVHRLTLELAGLPAPFDGFRIVQISDIHSGSFDNRENVERGVRLIMDQRPDLFVFTGDLVNNRADEIVPWIDIFSRIRAPYGQFSILGNHDYGDYVRWKSPEDKINNLGDLKQHHQSLGFRLLLDESVTIQKEGAQFTLLGVENWGKGFGERGKLEQALQGAGKTDVKILLSHDPSHWDAQVKNNAVKIHLTLSGHTHGMQFGIEFLGFKWSPVKYRYPNWAGLTEENGRYLYVNRGFGFLGFSGRVGIWPEITVITLKRKGEGREPAA